MLKKGIVFLLVLFILSGCGYALIGTGASSLPKHLKTIALPTFVNKTQEPQIEIELTRVIRDIFVRDGRLKVVSSERADSILDGELRHYEQKPIAFDASDRVTEYRVLIGVEISFRDLINNKVLLKQSINAEETLKVSANITDREAALRETRRKAFEKYSERVRSLVFEGF